MEVAQCDVQDRLNPVHFDQEYLQNTNYLLCATPAVILADF